jgi:hypothetical protein
MRKAESIRMRTTKMDGMTPVQKLLSKRGSRSFQPADRRAERRHQGFPARRGSQRPYRGQIPVRRTERGGPLSLEDSAPHADSSKKGLCE